MRKTFRPDHGRPPKQADSSPRGKKKRPMMPAPGKETRGSCPGCPPMQGDHGLDAAQRKGIKFWIGGASGGPMRSPQGLGRDDARPCGGGKSSQVPGRSFLPPSCQPKPKHRSLRLKVSQPQRATSEHSCNSTMGACSQMLSLWSPNASLQAAVNSRFALYILVPNPSPYISLL